MENGSQSDRRGAVPHEVHDAEARPIVVAGLALGVGVVIVFGIVFLLFHYFSPKSSPEGVNPMAGSAGLNPAVPRIEEHPSETYQGLRAQEDRALGSYGWVDKKTGIVRVPIDRAMEITLQRGLPVRKEAPAK